MCIRDRDATGSGGLDIIKELVADEKFTAPLMLVSNYPESQAEAVAAGAVQGFGKAELDKPSTLEMLGAYLKD